jgi:hypothetical protein
MYLLNWNPDRYRWDDHGEFVIQSENGELPVFDWSTGNRRNVEAGDRLFLVRQVRQRGIIASGYAVGPSYQGPHWDETREDVANYVKIRWDNILDPVDVLPIATLEAANLGVPWPFLLGSGVEVPSPSTERLENLWEQHLRAIGRHAQAAQITPTTESSPRKWRMSFRMGEGGPEMWPHCLEAGVAAITYEPIAKVDLSAYSRDAFRIACTDLSPSQRYSVEALRYEMCVGDHIYVKQGPEIIGKGLVIGNYRFEKTHAIRDFDRNSWRHVVPVEWDTEFEPVEVRVGDQQRYTVRPLTDEDVQRIEKELTRVSADRRHAEAMEGECYQRQVIFRTRNRTLIAAKKAISDCRCEVCGMSFVERYGQIGKGYIVAHHEKPIGSRKRASRTTLEEIRLVCPNCHAMLHQKTPAMSIELLRKIFEQHRSLIRPRRRDRVTIRNGRATQRSR